MEILAKLFSFSAGVFALDVSAHIHLWWQAVIICIKSAVAEACRNTDMHLRAAAQCSTARLTDRGHASGSLRLLAQSNLDSALLRA